MEAPDAAGFNDEVKAVVVETPAVKLTELEVLDR
jgi:hypothetical protein